MLTKFSTVSELPMREKSSLPLVKTIYERSAFPSHGGGLERAFMEYVDNDGEVERWIKISETRHTFATITYMREDGLLATYHPDFVVVADGRHWLVETKGENMVKDRNVLRKRKAASEWCAQQNRVAGEERWEYVVVDDRGFYAMRDGGATFTDLMERSRVSNAMIDGELLFG
jgi:type III restriction enzyme